MSPQVKELIAVGASITANCQPCLEFHVGKAREHGAGDKDIATAIAVGRAVRKGAAAKMDAFAETVGDASMASGCCTDTECSGAGG